MRHPAEEQLALYASGDLGFWARRRLERHLNGCSECADTAAEFAGLRGGLAESAAELPPELTERDWNALAAEMTANIRLGLAAGECVAAPGLVRRRPRMALAFAAAIALVLAVAAERPSSRSPVLRVPAAIEAGEVATFEASSAGIAVRSAGQEFSVPAPVDKDVIRTISTGGEVRSRYADDTGVTIVNVYAN